MKRKPGNTKDKIDRNLLHDYLWNTSDRLNIITITITDLADELGVTIYSMSRILGQMVKEGRLRRIGKKIEVVDPRAYQWVNTQI